MCVCVSPCKWGILKGRPGREAESPKGYGSGGERCPAWYQDAPLRQGLGWNLRCICCVPWPTCCCSHRLCQRYAFHVCVVCSVVSSCLDGCYFWVSLSLTLGVAGIPIPSALIQVHPTRGPHRFHAHQGFENTYVRLLNGTPKICCAFWKVSGEYGPFLLQQSSCRPETSPDVHFQAHAWSEIIKVVLHNFYYVCHQGKFVYHVA